MSCTSASGGLRKQIISQLCVLNINNTAKALIQFFAQKTQTTDGKITNHQKKINSKIEDHANLSEGQTVLGNITKRSSKIINHLDDNKVRSVFSDISVINNGIMKKVNEMEKEELIKKISELSVGMDNATIKGIMNEVNKRNELEIDPVELAKIKKIIANMFDYKGSPMPGDTGIVDNIANAATTASTAAANVATNAANATKDAFTRRMNALDTKRMNEEVKEKVETTDLTGGNKISHNKTTRNKIPRNKTEKKRHSDASAKTRSRAQSEASGKLQMEKVCFFERKNGRSPAL